MSIMLQQNFDLEHCYACGVAFAMPSNLVAVLRRTHRDFYCPNGHTQHYLAETEEEKLKRQLAAEQANRATVEYALVQAERKRRKLERRIAAGVCPCCNRHFDNLERHMGTKHKNFVQLPAADEPKQITA